MSIADDTMCMHYTLERLGGIKTQTDLQEFMEEIRYNISVNDEHRELTPMAICLMVLLLMIPMISI